MKRVYIVGIIVIVVILLVAASIFLRPMDEKASEGTGLPSGVNSVSLTSITYDNFASEIEQIEAIKALPEDAEIILKFYNFDSGEREWEQAYVIEKGTISETDIDSSAEIILSVHSKYLNGMTNSNFCTIIGNAHKNGDLGVETELSSASLAWKFKNMFKYKSCLGL